MTIAFYIGTIALVASSATAILQSIIGIVFSRLSGNVMLGMFLGAVAVWMLIQYAWVSFEGGQVPVAVYAASIGALCVHGYVSADKLNENARFMMSAEIWAMVAVGFGAGVMESAIRWY